MKKCYYVIILMVCILALITGCETDIQSESEGTEIETMDANTTNMVQSNPEGEQWTILVYMCGTDLETLGNYASVNISEMTAATQSENVNVIFQSGGTEQWAYEAVDESNLERWKIGYDSFELVDSQPLASMGEAETLGNFLKWGVETYPADKYMALLWNHGGGSVSGIAVDELFDGDALNLKELAEGISMAGTQFELIGFDACLMSTLETASALSPYARYMVASQEIEPGTGWDYAAWLDYLAANPQKTGLELGTVICDSYFEKSKDSGMESIVTLSVTDLSKIPELVTNFDKMAGELKGFTASPDKLRPLTQAIVRAESYGGNNDNEGYTNMVDLGDLALCAEGVVSETGDALLESLFAAVPYQVSGSGRQKANGLSVYVPLGISKEEMDSYAELAAVSGEYLRFMEGMYDWEVPEGVVINQPVLEADQSPEVEQTEQPAPVVEQVEVSGITIAQALNQEEYEMSYTLDLTEDGYILLTVDQGADIISSVAYDLFYLDEETNSLWYLGNDYDVNMSEDGTQYWDNFRNLWTIINGNLCMMQALSFTEDYILYTVPVSVNGNPTNLRMLYHLDTAEYEVIGTWDGIDEATGMSSRDVLKLQDGDEVTLLFSAADLTSGEGFEFEGGSFVVEGPIVAEEATLFDGIYYYQYSITDIFGNVYESEMAKMVSEDGNITVELE